MDRPPDRRLDLPWILALGLLGLLASLPYWNAKGDDVFITFQYVHNLVVHGQLAYNLGEPTYGFTSPLWVGILSLFYAVLHDMYASGWIACLFTWILCLLALWRLASRLIASRAWRAVAITLVVVDPWFMRWAFAGQEITLKIAASAFLVSATGDIAQRSEFGWGRSIGFGLLLSLGMLTRPEFGLFTLLALGALLYKGRYRPALLAALAAAIVYGGWALFCHGRFGLFLPHTILVKTANLRGPTTLRQRFLYTLTWAAPRYVSIVVLPILGVLLTSAIVLVRRPAWRRELRDPFTLVVLLLWAAGVTIGYLASGTYMASMYTLLFSPLIPLAGVALLEAAGRAGMRPRASHLLAFATLCTVAVSAGVFAFRLGSFSWLTTDQYRRGDDIRLIQFAQWIHDNLPPDARIATSELGIVGWYSQRYMIDLEGIATPSMLTGDPERALIDARPDYFIFYGDPRPRYGPFRLEPVKEVRFRRVGGRYPLHYEERCTLYRVAAPLRDGAS